MLLLEVSKLMRSCSPVPLLWSQPYLSFSLCHPPVLLRSSEAELVPLLGAECLNAIPISQGKYPDGRGPIPTPPGGEPAQSCGPHDPTQQDQVPSTVNAYAMQCCGGPWLQGGTQGVWVKSQASVAAGECSPESPSRSQHFYFSSCCSSPCMFLV